MRQKVFLLIFSALCLSFSSGFGQAPPVFDWQTCLGGSSYDAATKVLKMTDGGYLLVGTTNSITGNVSGNHGLSDVWVVKLDASGNFQWQQCFGGNKVDAAVSAVQLPGGKVFVLATTNSNNGNVTNNHGGFSNTSDVWLLALSPSGSLLWQKTYGGTSFDAAHALLKTSDDNLLIGASTESINGDVTSNHGGEDFWLIKVDTSGTMIWQKTFGGTGTDICNALAESDDGYLAAGSSTSTNCDVTGNRGGADFWIVKTDHYGNMDWEKSYGGSSNESAFSALVNGAGNFVIAGYTNSVDSDIVENHGSSEFWLLELDAYGSMVMQSTFGGSNSDIAFSITQADADGYMIAGTSSSTDYDLLNSQAHGAEDCWLMKADLSGNIIWSRTYGGPGGDRAFSVLQTDDGGYLIAGYTQSNSGQVSGNHGGNDVWIAKLSCLSPAASFTFADDTVCVGSLVNFSNTSVNSAVYTWMADGVPFSFSDNASFQFINAGSYEISLAGATCYSSDTVMHTFIAVNTPSPVVSQDAPYVCSGTSISLSTAYAQSYLWLPDSQVTQTIQITEGGDYWVQIDYHQCTAVSPVLHVTEYASPEVNLGTDTSFCQTTVFTLQAPAGYQSYLWQDGSTNTAFYTTVGGLYYVTVSSAYCSTTDSINLSLVQCNLAIAAFSASQTSICENTCIDFTDLSSYANSWEWHFPGSNTPVSYDQNPTNICYAIPGTYEVELIVTNSYGGNGLTISNYITVNANPSSAFVIANGFWLSSSVAAAGYQWYFQGNPIPGATLQSYSATQDGYYFVVLDNGTGCTTTSDSVYVNVTGIATEGMHSDLGVYPNPAKDFFIIKALPSGNCQIELTDLAGKQIFLKQLNDFGQNGNHQVSTAELSNGTYFLKVLTDNGLLIERVIVSH